MSKIFFAGFFMILMLSGIVYAAENAPAQPTQISTKADPLSGRQATITRLKNGLQVLILKDTRFPLVSTRLYVHAGSVYENPDQAGISHLLEHMVFKGTAKRPKGEISREIEAAGGYLNAATSYDDTVYIVDIPSRNWKLALDASQDMAFNATIDPAELESEKNVVLSEMDMRMKDKPEGQLFEALLNATLRGTPYERPIIGSAETIKKISAQDIKNYIKTLYQPSNMLLVVVGDVNPDEVLQESEKIFSPYVNDLALPQNETYDVSLLPQKQAQVIVKPGPWNKAYVAMAFPVPGHKDFRSVPLDVLAYLLGGDKTSLFYKKFKYEQQLVDSIHVGNVSFERLGLFLVSATLDADKVETFWKELVHTFATLNPAVFSEAELQRAKLNLEDEFHRASETLPELASHLGQFQFYHSDNGEQAQDNALESLRAINLESVKNAFQTWCDPNRLSAVILPPNDTKMPDFTALLKQGWQSSGKRATSLATRTGKTEKIDLGHGCSLVLIPDTTLPYVSTTLIFSGGDSLLTPDQQGLASLTASVLTKGTIKRNATEIQAFLSDRAYGLGVSAGKRSFRFSLTGPSRFSEDIFGLLREILINPAFSAAETTRAIHEQVAAINRMNDQPLVNVLRRKLPPFLFPKSVAGYLQLGEIETVQKFTPENLQQFWNEQRQRPYILSIAGNFDREKMMAFAKTLPQSSAEKILMPEPLWGTEKNLDASAPGRNQAHLLLVFKTVKDSDPEAPALNLLNNILSGMGGPLFRELRDEQGLGYTVTSFLSQSKTNGFMGLYIGTTPDKMDQAEAGFKKILDQLAIETLPLADLDRGKNQIEGDYYRGIQSLGSRADEAAALTLDDRPLSFLRDQIEKARNVTPDQLREMAKKYLVFENAYRVRVLP